MDIFIGLVVLALIIGGGYVITHHKAPATPSPASLANTVAEAAAASWSALKADLPEMISTENAQLKADMAALRAALQAAQDKLAADKAAHDAAMAGVAARVAAAVTASPELPPSPVLPQVAAAQAEDTAAIQVATAQLKGM